MRPSDFKDFSNFTKTEIKRTNANLEGIKYNLIKSVQQLRTKANRRIHFLYNGLNSGSHASPEHVQGKAADWYLNKNDGSFILSHFFVLVASCGFTGIGFYYCEETDYYTFHTDIGRTVRVWSGYKKRKKDEWEYTALIVDPAFHLIDGNLFKKLE